MISTHILDTSIGMSAGGVKVQLLRKDKQDWVLLQEGLTTADGRFVFRCEQIAASYELVFETEEYFKKNSREGFFVNPRVCFKVEDTKRKYHVPLLLNPFGYSTYRGS